MSIAGQLPQYIRVYNGYGISKQSLKMIAGSLPSIAREWSLTVLPISVDDIKKAQWVSNTRLLVIGGGFDLGYLHSLDVDGTTVIRSYVNSGGAYLGICAGGYFGCEEVEFALKTELEVKGQRPLKFFRGCCIGPVFPGFKYDSEDGASAPTIVRADYGSTFSCYFNGGGYFQTNGGSESDVKILARYDDTQDKDAAVVMCKAGKGRAVLSGIHFEYDEELMADAMDSGSTHPRIKEILPSLRSTRAERLRFYRDIVSCLLEFREQPDSDFGPQRPY